MKALLLAVVTASAAVLSGCGDDSGTETEPTGPRPTAGDPSVSSTGTTPRPSGSGGNGGTGGEGAGGSAGAPVEGLEGAHCAPGETQIAVRAYLGALENCFYDLEEAGGGVSPEFFQVRGVNLEEPVGPGGVFAFSATMRAANGSMMEPLGYGRGMRSWLELLATSEMGLGIRCMEVRPEQGTYSHLLWVWFGGGAHDDATLCTNGECSEESPEGVRIFV
jgi:hypothetical protein